MKKILLITTKYTKGNDNKWLTNEIAEYAISQGNEVSVLSLNWQSYENGTENYNSNGVNVIRYSLPKFFYRKNFLCSILKLSLFSIVGLFKFRKKIKKNDVILMTSPCIATWALCFIKGKSSNVLILWDFFPYFMSGFWVGIKRRLTPLLSLVEGFLYNQFQSIGVMTPGYEKFLKEKYILKDDVEVFHFPLWTNVEKQKEINKAVLRNKFGFNATDFILIYGGAISKVQQLDNLMRLAEMTLADKKLKYLIVGGGVDYSKIKNIISEYNLVNVTLLDSVSRVQYEEYIAMSDLGFVSLSQKHKVPSFPSKSIDYFKVSLPILASIDDVTDYGYILECEIKGGLSVMAGDVSMLHEKLLYLINNPAILLEMGGNGRKYYENNMKISDVYNRLKCHF